MLILALLLARRVFRGIQPFMRLASIAMLGMMSPLSCCELLPAMEGGLPEEGMRRNVNALPHFSCKQNARAQIERPKGGKA